MKETPLNLEFTPTKDKHEIKSVVSSDHFSFTQYSEVNPKIIFIFDFDDTLFCTKYLNTFAINTSDIFAKRVNIEEINSALTKQINEIDDSEAKLFEQLLKKSYDVIILTNADLNWVNNCLTYFLKNLNKIIIKNNIKIFSAKKFGNKETEPNIKKIIAFKKIMYENYFKKNKNEYIIVSIGDGDAEKKAVFKLNEYFKNMELTTKFIKMIQCPSALGIKLQIDYLKENYCNLIANDDNLFQLKLDINTINNEIKLICNSKYKILDKKTEDTSNKSLLSFDSFSEKSDFFNKYYMNVKEEESIFFNIQENNKKIKIFNKCLGRKYYLDSK